MMQNEIKFGYRQYSENSILIQGPSIISEILLDVLVFYKKSIEKKYSEVIVEVVLSYNSLLIYYNSTIEDVYDRVLELKSIKFDTSNDKKLEKRVWNIPVCYDIEISSGLKDFADQKSLPISEIISLHSSPLYTVFFIGFLPGFLYLGGLSEKLYLPRKRVPDLKVEKGSVAIGGNQTGIYPRESPGGWHVIGRSPLLFFEPENQECCFIRPGDKLKFISITEKEYNDISLLVSNKLYIPEFSVL